MWAREELRQFNEETGRSRIGTNLVKNAKQAESAFEHLGITFDKVSSKISNKGLTVKNFAAPKEPKQIDPLSAFRQNMSSLRSMAATPIESTEFKMSAGSSYEEFSKKVMDARTRLEAFNEEVKKSKTPIQQTDSDLQHLGVTYDKVSGKMKAPLGGPGADAAWANNFTAKGVGDPRAAAMSKLAAMKDMAATPIESSAFRNSVGPAFGEISKQVTTARQDLKQFNSEMGATKEKAQA